MNEGWELTDVCGGERKQRVDMEAKTMHCCQMRMGRLSDRMDALDKEMGLRLDSRGSNYKKAKQIGCIIFHPITFAPTQEAKRDEQLQTLSD